MVITNRAEAKEGGFAQVRAALVAFEGDVVAKDARGNETGFAQWGTEVDPATGLPKPPKEFLQIVCVNVVPTEVKEDLTMDISEGWTFRVNASDFKGSFWMEAFLLSAEKNKILIPEGLIGKRIQFKQFTLEAVDSKGVAKPKFNSTNFIIEKVVGNAGAMPVTPPTATPVATPAPASVPANAPAPVAGESVDPMVVLADLAVGKTEAQLRSAAAMHPLFKESALLPLIKAGAVTGSLVTEKKLVLVDQGGKKVYQKVVA